MEIDETELLIGRYQSKSFLPASQLGTDEQQSENGEVNTDRHLAKTRTIEPADVELMYDDYQTKKQELKQQSSKLKKYRQGPRRQLNKSNLPSVGSDATTSHRESIYVRISQNDEIRTMKSRGTKDNDKQVSVFQNCSPVTQLKLSCDNTRPNNG